MKKTVAIAATAQMDMITKETDYQANACEKEGILYDITISFDHSNRSDGHDHWEGRLLRKL